MLLLLSRHYFVSKCLRELAVSLLILYELRGYDLGAFADRLEVTWGHSFDRSSIRLLARLHSHFGQKHGRLAGCFRRWIQYWRSQRDVIIIFSTSWKIAELSQILVEFTAYSYLFIVTLEELSKVWALINTRLMHCINGWWFIRNTIFLLI